MATRTINTILALKDQFSAPAKKATSNVKNINREIKRTKNQIKKFGESIKNTVTKVAKYSAAAGLALTAAFGKQSIDAAKAQIEAETKLYAVLKNVKGVTDQQINSIKKYSAVLQKQGVIGDEVALAGVQQLGTFQLQADTIKTLMPGMQDLLAQQKGVNASSQDAVNIGNLVGKVMNGQVGALSRVGISFTAAQEKILKYGTETEKAATLAEVLKANVGGVNAALAQTDDGKMKQTKNQLSDMKEEVGRRLLPMLGKLYAWFGSKIPNIQDHILKTLDKVEGFSVKAKPYVLTVVNTIKELLERFQQTYQFIKKNWGTIAPILLTIVGAMTAYKIVTLAQIGYTKAFAISEGIKTAVLATGATTVNAMTIAQWALNAAMKANPIGLVIAGITALITVGILVIKNWDKIKAKGAEVWAGLKDGFKGFANFFINIYNYLVGKLNKFKIKIPKWIPQFGGKEFGFKLPEMETFARGGIATKPSIFGDDGAEIAIPLKKNNPRSQQLIKQAERIVGEESDHGVVVKVIIQGDVYGFDDFKNKVAQAVVEVVKTNRPNVVPA